METQQIFIQLSGLSHNAITMAAQSTHILFWYHGTPNRFTYCYNTMYINYNVVLQSTWVSFCYYGNPADSHSAKKLCINYNYNGTIDNTLCYHGNTKNSYIAMVAQLLYHAYNMLHIISIYYAATC